MTQDPTLRFQLVRHWRAWREWPAAMALATGLALWLFLAAGVVVPLSEALVRLDPSTTSAPAEVHRTNTSAPDWALAAGGAADGADDGASGAQP
jgi:hypothetical protein